MLEDGFFDPARPFFIRRGALPHWRQDRGLYFVTFRLSDSLPQPLLAAWKLEQERWRRLHAGSDDQTLILRTLEQQKRIDRWLDKGYGSCVLADPAVKQIVVAAMRYFDGVRYELGPFTVASNHVHALLRTALDVDLSRVLYSWKRYSSTKLFEIAKVREAFKDRGHLWQAEPFDHLVRNSEGLDKICRNIRHHAR